jgi:hypothetical protein
VEGKQNPEDFFGAERYGFAEPHVVPGNAKKKPPRWWSAAAFCVMPTKPKMIDKSAIPNKM